MRKPNIYVSTVISLLQWISWLIRFAGTLISFASWLWVIFIGLRNSSKRISPGVIGDSFFPMFSLLMIINNFHIKGIFVFPYKTYTPLIVNSDTVLTFSIAFQLFKSVPWGTLKLFNETAAFRTSSFNRAVLEMLRNFLTLSSSKSFQYFYI